MTVKNTYDRRSAIMLFLSRKRKTTIPELMSVFNVAKRTIQKDLKYLELFYKVPLVSQKGVGGYVAVVDGWQLNKVYFTQAEVSAIEKALNILSKNPENKDLILQIQKILCKYNKPITGL